MQPVACSKRSDSGERCRVKKAMKSRGGLGTFIFSRSLLLRTAPHYLNAWNRLHLQLNLHRAASTLGVTASGRLMEVGRSIEARHTLQNIIIISSRNICLFWIKHATGAALLVHNRSSLSISDCIFLLHILEIKRN